MFRTIILFLYLVLHAVNLNAQPNDVPKIMEDSSFLLETSEDEEAENSSGFAKDVLSDTSINFSDFSIQRDSISAFKLKKEYGWVSNIDSFLLAQKKEANNKATVVSKQNRSGSFIGRIFNSAILQAFMWLIAAALVIFIIYKLFLSEGVFGRRSVKKTVDIETDEDDIRLLNDYDLLLRKAYGEQNWRFAMRFLFLKTLQKLNENNLISYAVDKTNSAYVKELTETRKEDFAALALYYEYIWYGKAAIEKTIFDSIENKFNSFLNKI